MSTSSAHELSACDERDAGRVEAGAGASVDSSRRADEPAHGFYRYALARSVARTLAPTAVRPDHLAAPRPFLAAIAGYLVTYADWRHLALGAACFELSAILGCTDELLAREKQLPPRDEGVGALSDGLGVVLLYAGIFVHFHLHPPPLGGWSHALGVDLVLALALVQGALRSFAADHYRRKYASSSERGAKLAGFLWGVTSGGVFSTLVVVSLLVNELWLGQLFFATAGFAWIALAAAGHEWIARSAARAPKPAGA